MTKKFKPDIVRLMNTFFELIISIIILSSLAVLGISTYQNWQDQHRLELTALLLQNQIEAAKTFSITRPGNINLCASINLENCNPSWAGHLIIFESAIPPRIDRVLSQTELLGETVHINYHAFNNSLYIHFAPSGELNYNGTFLLHTAHHSLRLTLSTTGIMTEK